MDIASVLLTRRQLGAPLQHVFTMVTLYLIRYASNPTEAHIAAAKKVLRYLKRVPNLGITYGKSDGLVGYINANWV